MRFVLIANPVAGRGARRSLTQNVYQRLLDAGADCTVHWTTPRTSAVQLAEQALAAVDNGAPLCLTSCGGDGTVQAVVNAILNSRASNVVLGVVPCGRCNDFATAFGIGADSAEAAARLLSGRTTTVDIGRINGRYFCTIAALGFDAAVSRYVNDRWLPLSGTAAYILGTLRTLMTYKARVVKLVFDDSIHEGPVFLAASANTACYGGNLHIAPDADPCDGLLEICIVSQVSRLGGMRLLRQVLKAAHRKMPQVRFVRSRTMCIESPEPLEIWADGEYITDTPARIEIVPQALKLLAAP